MQGKKILIVDDDPEVLEILERKLKLEGFEVFIAAEGQAAVERAVKERPDLILLDIVLPDIDGSEVVQRIRTHPFIEKKIPVLFLSGIVTGEERNKYMELTVGGETYPALPKPVTITDLLQGIRGLLPAS
ncbi:MAG TPA: response regulator [Candidatus Omnitrophota bacterium]|nr:response regulator [Candidatus Omnitrophota bacterium]HPB67835.1 response regulator [Candidatus Omnitrophota bacterium]HQO58759.1 response regulator [Candidatus Omnitrophota bacterium]